MQLTISNQYKKEQNPYSYNAFFDGLFIPVISDCI